MVEFIHHLTERSFCRRTVAMMENGSWAPQAIRVMQGMLSGSKDLMYTENNVRILSALNDDSRAQIEALAEELCR
jgi:flavorubredoxin